MKDDRKMVLVSQDYPPPLSGGSLVYLYNLVENSLDPMDILTSLLPNGMEEISSPRQRVIHSRFLIRSDEATTFRLFGMYLYLLLWALKIGVLRQYNLVIFFTSAIGNGFFATLFHLLRIKIVCFALAEEVPLAQKTRGWKGILKRFCIRGYPRANAFVSNCDFAKEILINLGVDSNRICVIPSPICHSKLRLHHAKNSRKNRHYEVLTVGRLVRRKGIHLLIDALDILKAEVPNTHLTIVGDGDEMDALKEQVKRKGLEERVTFTGSINDDDKLSELYHACDLFVLANLMLEDGNCEGTPNVLIEASAHRKPVIAGIEGGTSSAVIDGQTGYLLDPRDIPNMAQAIKKILLDRELAAQMGAEGRRKVEEEHDPAKAGLRFSTFLQQVQ